jgi:Uncharacterized protein conserved in bacteria
MKHLLHCFRLFFCGTLVALTLVCAPRATFAAQQGTQESGWLARVTGHTSAPPQLVAVDKSKQQLFLFEKKSPLRLAAQYACTTGKNDGDKRLRGDRKTPEGIYFVVERLNSGLNYEKYGNEAYTLNYPNPVDRLRRKTGYGIWIHGRGTPIEPKVTDGCVSLNNGDIAILGKNLTPGTPVALADAITFTPVPQSTDSRIIAALERKTFAWAKAWSSRSKSFFDYYDPKAYDLAQGERFSAFRSQKERLFRTLPWIDTKVRNVQTLQGPGYWVTWFQQEYRAPNLTSKGVRRLYWQHDKNGEFYIVGMEWEPQLFGTLTAGINDAPVASAPPPAKPGAKPVAAAKPVASVEPATPKKAAPGTAVAVIAQPKKQAGSSAEISTQGVAEFIETWRKAWERGNLNAYAACYAPRAVQGNNNGVDSIRSHKRGLWRHSAPKQVVLTNIRITTNQQTIIARMHQAYINSDSFADKGVKTLHIQKKNNVWRIIREEWSAL